MAHRQNTVLRRRSFCLAKVPENLEVSRRYHSRAIAYHQGAGARENDDLEFPRDRFRRLEAETVPGIGIQSEERDPFRIRVVILRVAENSLIDFLGKLLFRGKITTEIANAAPRILRKKSDTQVSLDLAKVLQLPAKVRKLTGTSQQLTLDITIESLLQERQ